jgi:hypothetical protein
MKTTIKTFEVKKEANAEWKKEFSLMGLVKYINKANKTAKIAQYCTLLGLNHTKVTIDMLKEGGKSERFLTHDKAGNVTGNRTIFTLWFAMDCLKSYSEKTI